MRNSGHCATLMLNLVPPNLHLCFFPAVTLSESSSVITSCPDLTQLLFCFSPCLVVGGLFGFVEGFGFFLVVDFIFVLWIVTEELKPQIIHRLYMSFHGSKFFTSWKNQFVFEVYLIWYWMQFFPSKVYFSFFSCYSRSTVQQHLWQQIC